jgi:HEPN domain-containing protein
MDQHTQQAEALNKSAADRAAAGDHRAAIKALEQATQLLVRALQAAGMPVY